jgi:hypothetical protein
MLGFPAGEIPRDGKYHSLRVQLIPPHGMPPLKASWRRGYRAPDDSVRQDLLENGLYRRRKHAAAGA